MILNENGKEITNPDFNLGYITQDKTLVFISWVVDEPAVTKQVVIKEYPNGGKDVKTETVVPEKGHWEVVDENGKPVKGYEVPDNLQHGTDIPDYFYFERYKLYTPEQLEQIEADRIETEKAVEKQLQIENAVNSIGDIDMAIIELYELIGE